MFLWKTLIFRLRRVFFLSSSFAAGVACAIVSRKISNSVTQTFLLLFSQLSSNFSLFVFHVLSFRQSIKSSFRDKDKPSRFKDLQTTTRFQVEPQNEESDDDSNVSQEDRELLNDNEYDTKYGKSFRSV